MSSWANILKKNIDKKPKKILSKKNFPKKVEEPRDIIDTNLNRFLYKHESDIEDILFVLEDICNSLCVNILDKRSKHYYTDFLDMITNNIYLDKYVDKGITDDNEEDTDFISYDI